MNQLRFNTNVYKVTQKIMIKSHAETGGKSMMTIEEKINTLPKEAKEEVYDFIDFVIRKNQKEEKLWMMKLSEKSLNRIWDNPEDDVYNELLKK